MGWTVRDAKACLLSVIRSHLLLLKDNFKIISSVLVVNLDFSITLILKVVLGLNFFRKFETEKTLYSLHTASSEFLSC